jgi:acyl-CoA dehydrogenase
MDFELSEEQRAIAATVRDFVARELVPHEDLVERLDAVPEELAREIRGKAIAAGLYAANFPAELGGGGLDALGLTLAERELGWTSWALQTLVSRPSNILQACRDGQVETYLLPTVRGERVDCLAMTEPGAGSDVRSMTTMARRDGGDWVINGAKHFISYADMADFVVLFAVTGTAQGPRGERSAISAFLVDHGTPGFTVSRGTSSVSHRGYHHCELAFADCRVPGSALRRRGLEFRPAERVAPGRSVRSRRASVGRPGGARLAPSGRRPASSSASRSGGSRASVSAWPIWRPRSRPPSS